MVTEQLMKPHFRDVFLEDSELTFTNEKPYVIYGYAAVDEGDILTVETGARVHFSCQFWIVNNQRCIFKS